MVRPTRTSGRHRAGPVPSEEPEGGASSLPPAPTALLAQDLTGDPFLAHPRRHPQPMVASLDGQGPPSELQALIDAVTTGHGIDLCRRIQRTTGTQDRQVCSLPIPIWTESSFSISR